VTDRPTSVEQWAPEILVRLYRGDHLIEQQFCDSAEAGARAIETWEAQSVPGGELIVIEPHPPEAIVALLREIADAIEQERPLAMPRPFPRIRLQLVTQGTEPADSKLGELRLLWMEQAHPGG
jgi:hypothetical protein